MYIILYNKSFDINVYSWGTRDRRGHDRMVVEFTSTCAISAYHHKRREFESR